MKLTPNQISTLRKAYSLRFVSYPTRQPTKDGEPTNFIQATVRSVKDGNTNYKIACAESTITRDGIPITRQVDHAQHTLIVHEQPGGPDVWRTICSWIRPGDLLSIRWSSNLIPGSASMRKIDLMLAVYRSGARTRTFQLARVATIVEDSIAGDTITLV